MISPIHPTHHQPPHHFSPTSQPTCDQKFCDCLVQGHSSIGLLKWVQNTLRNFRDSFFGEFITIDPPKETRSLTNAQEVLSELEKSGSKKEAATLALGKLSQDARRFLEIGIRKHLLKEVRPTIKPYPHANAFLEDRPHAKEILDLLRVYIATRNDLLELSKFLPTLRKQAPSLRMILDGFNQLPVPLRSAISFSFAKMNTSPETKPENLDTLLIQNPSKEPLFRTAVATAVRGLKMHEEPSLWHQEAWRCKFWYV
ncbi:MAG: hypothetical protein KGZ39_03600 [Simkania sp.]|nr:hypothetical protein [Simkania sp.]